MRQAVRLSEEQAQTSSEAQVELAGQAPMASAATEQTLTLPQCPTVLVVEPLYYSFCRTSSASRVTPVWWQRLRMAIRVQVMGTILTLGRAAATINARSFRRDAKRTTRVHTLGRRCLASTSTKANTSGNGVLSHTWEGGVVKGGMGRIGRFG